MKNVIYIWLNFILLVSFSEELDLANFLFLSSSMFYLTYFYIQINPTILSKRITILLFYIQAIILWYVAFVYNDFLCFNPIPYKIFISLLLIYFFITFYFISKILRIKSSVKLKK